MVNSNFIITSDCVVKDKLKKLGFTEVPSLNTDIFVFVNDMKISFTKDIDISKIRYSNKLFY